MWSLDCMYRLLVLAGKDNNQVREWEELVVFSVGGVSCVKSERS